MKIEFFDSLKELEALTGMDDIDMWKAGFDLDDWDWGFRAKELYVIENEDECGLKDYCVVNDAPYYMWDIITGMMNYCVGLRVVRYGDYWYYMRYHA